jgi:hypothetical protein
MNDPPLKMPYEKRLKMFELDYFRGNQILYGTEKAILQFEIVKHLYPQMCATPATPAVEAGNPFDASGNEREALEISATIDSAENQRLRFHYIPAQNALPMVPAGQREDAKGVTRLPNVSATDEDGNLCVTASQLSTLPLLSKIGIPPGHGVEISEGQKRSMDAIWHKANNVLFTIILRTVSPNVAEYVENTDLPGDGYGAIQNLKRAYLDSATVTNSEKLAELMKFSKWFPDIENPQIALAKLQTLNLNLDPAHRHNDPTLSMITIGALKVNANYTPLVTSLQTMGQLDIAEVIKLTTWVIKHWNDNNKTFKGNKDRATFNKQTENALKKINGKLFTMQSHSQAGAGGGTKRKFGNKGGNNKNRPDKPEPKCVTCGGSHLAQHCSKNEGKITCNTTWGTSQK